MDKTEDKKDGHSEGAKEQVVLSEDQRASVTSLIKDIFAQNSLGSFAAPEYAAKFENLLHMLISENEKYNLTAITEPADIILRHFADSLTCSGYIPSGAVTADVGCGAGFPCLPLCIVRSDICMTAIDSTGKKLAFVKAAVDALDVKLSIHEGRAEQASELRERFDCVCARAVAPLPALCELCLPLVRVGGRFIAMKGASASDELRAAENAIKILGARVSSFDEFTLSDAGKRGIIVAEKISNTPAKYPRMWAKIKKDPL